MGVELIVPDSKFCGVGVRHAIYFTPERERVNVNLPLDRPGNLGYHKPKQILWRKTLEPNDLARTIVDLISDKKGVDTVLLDIHSLSYIADYFVVSTAESERQLKALADDIQKELKKQSVLPLGVEGAPESGWVLLDYGAVIAHLFSPEMREYYQLEQMWARAPVVVRVQ